MDLATSRIKAVDEQIEVSPGDIVTIIEPFEKNQNFTGLVVEVQGDHILVYHSDINRKILWIRRVKCEVTRL